MSYFENFDLKSIENMELFAKQVVEGFIIGLHKSPFHGFSVEFAEHRIYNPGDTTKNIDWKVYARTDKLFTKRFEEETNLRCHFVIDSSSSMYFPQSDKSQPINKLQFSGLAAASLMNLLKKQRDAFGLTLFDQDIKVFTREKSSTKHYRLMLQFLEQLINDSTPEKTTNLVDTLHEVADRVHRRSLIVIFSDMLDDPSKSEALFAALQHLRYNKHEVVLFHTLDKKLEESFEFENRPYQFIDLESGEKLRLQAHEVKEYYAEKMETYKKDIRTKCLQYKIDLVEADIRKGFIPVLQAYMVKRKKMLK
jgi:uncharacterized protein (DUF58 family)